MKHILTSHLEASGNTQQRVGLTRLGHTEEEHRECEGEPQHDQDQRGTETWRVIRSYIAREYYDKPVSVPGLISLNNTV